MIILALIFTVVLVVSFRSIRTGMDFALVPSLILSVCVSALATIGLNQQYEGTSSAILIPYAALAIAILVALLISLLVWLMRKGETEKSSQATREGNGNMDEERRRKVGIRK